MKKSKIALAVVASVAIIATGGAWFTGSQVKQKYSEIVNNANNSLKRLSDYGISKAQIKNVELNKGFFSSDITYDLEVELDEKTYLFKGNDKVFHGPLPLNRLSKGNFLPVLLSAESHIAPQDEIIKTALASNNAVDGIINVTYAGEIESDSTINPIKFADNDTQLETSAIHFSGDFSGFGKQKVSAESFKLISTKQQGGIEITGLEYDANFKQDATYSNITGIGPYSAKIKNIKFVTEQQHVININDLSTKGNSQIKNSRVFGDGVFSGKANWTVNDQTADLGKLNLDLVMNFDAKGLNDFYQFINKLDTQDPEEIKQIQAASEAMFSNGLTLKLNDLSLENAKGKNLLVSTIDLKKFNVAELAQAKTITENLGKIFKPSHLNLTLNLAATEESLKQWMTIAPEAQGDNPEQQAKKAIANLITSAKNSEIAIVTDKDITINVEIKGSKLFLNGKEVPEEQLQMMVFMLMMGAN